MMFWVVLGSLIFKNAISPTSYIFARNALCHSLFSAVYEDFNPTFFALFLPVFGNFNNFR